MARSQLADAAFLAGRGQGLLRRRQSQEHRSLMQGPALHESKDPTRCMPVGGGTQIQVLMCAVSGFNAAQCSSAPCWSNTICAFSRWKRGSAAVLLLALYSWKVFTAVVLAWCEANTSASCSCQTNSDCTSRRAKRGRIT